MSGNIRRSVMGKIFCNKIIVVDADLKSQFADAQKMQLKQDVIFVRWLGGFSDAAFLEGVIPGS